MKETWAHPPTPSHLSGLFKRLLIRVSTALANVQREALIPILKCVWKRKPHLVNMLMLLSAITPIFSPASPLSLLLFFNQQMCTSITHTTLSSPFDLWSQSWETIKCPVSTRPFMLHVFLASWASFHPPWSITTIKLTRFTPDCSPSSPSFTRACSVTLHSPHGYHGEFSEINVCQKYILVIFSCFTLCHNVSFV